MTSRGAYSTKQRSLIIDYLEAHQGRRLTVDELAQEAGVGRTTAYRLMEQMVEQGAAHKYQSAEGACCYQFMTDPAACARHAHMVCTGCAELVHLDCDEVRSLAQHLLEEHGFVLDEKRTVLYGLCAICAKGEG